MGAYNAAGTRLTTGTFPKTAYTPADAEFTLTADVYTDVPLAGEEANFRRPGGKNKSGRALWKKSGEVVKQSEINGLLAQATVTAISPATGLAAGGTACTITGTNLDGVTAITFGGTAATSVVVVTPTTITCTAPAHAAGAVSVVFTDDSGTVTKTNFYTYT